jgi:hypothetical protein
MPILKPKVLYQRHKQTSDMPILKPKVWGLVVSLI